MLYILHRIFHHPPPYFLTNIISPRTAKTIPATVHSKEQTSPTINPHHIAGDNTIQPSIAAFTIAVVDRLTTNPAPKTQIAHRSHMFSLFILSIIIVSIKPSQESAKNLNLSRYSSHPQSLVLTQTCPCPPAVTITPTQLPERLFPTPSLPSPAGTEQPLTKLASLDTPDLWPSKRRRRNGKPVPPEQQPLFKPD